MPRALTQEAPDTTRIKEGLCTGYEGPGISGTLLPQGRSRALTQGPQHYKGGPYTGHEGPDIRQGTPPLHGRPWTLSKDPRHYKEDPCTGYEGSGISQGPTASQEAKDTVTGAPAL